MFSRALFHLGGLYLNVLHRLNESNNNNKMYSFHLSILDNKTVMSPHPASSSFQGVAESASSEVAIRLQTKAETAESDFSNRFICVLIVFQPRADTCRPSPDRQYADPSNHCDISIVIPKNRSQLYMAYLSDLNLSKEA